MRKDFLSFDDISKSEIFKIFELAKQLKKRRINHRLRNRMICLFFERPSIRSKLSFEVGIKESAGEVVYLDRTRQLSTRESIEDTARALDNYVDAVIARVYSHQTLETMSKLSDIHVINDFSDLTRPCQILSDLFTIQEKFKSFKGLKLAYVGDGNNTCHSLLLSCSKIGLDITVACPKEFEPNREIIHRAVDFGKISKCDVNITEYPKKAVKDANIVYTNAFFSFGDKKEKEKRLKVFLPDFQVNNKLLSFASSDFLFMHPFPVNRGEEVTYDIIDGPRSIVLDQVENRLHVQKALLIKMMGKKIFKI